MNWELLADQKGSIVIYKSPDGSSAIDVKFTWETVWLNQNQLSKLFDIDRTVITRHINNIIKNWEIQEKSNVQKMHFSHSDKPVKFYNLDFILAVWYRVNAKKWIEFRRRSSQILKEYIIKGYSINQKRLTETGLKTFEQAIALVKRNIENNILTDQETKGMLSLITNYAYSWIILQKYDEGTLSLENFNTKKAYKLDYIETIKVINDIKKELLPKGEVSKMFGIEKNDGLKGVLEQIYQTFDKQELYPSIEEKAAALLYFTIKNHPFADWNKKIWAFLFVFFLAKNKCLYKSNGDKRIDDNTLVALTLLIATSDKNEKNMILKLVANFLIEK